jgi:hypothetical protein
MSNPWLILTFKLSMIVIIGFIATVLSNKLPESIRPSVQSQITKELAGQGPKAYSVALTLAMICSHYISSLAAIFGLSIALLVEVWKLIEYFGLYAAALLLIAVPACIAATAHATKSDWIGNTEGEYKAGLGKKLDRTIWLLWILLFLVSAVGPVIDIYRAQTQAVSHSVNSTASITAS